MTLKLKGQVKATIENGKITSKDGFIVERKDEKITLSTPSGITVNGTTIDNVGRNIRGSKIVIGNGSNDTVIIEGDINGIGCVSDGVVVNQTIIGGDVETHTSSTKDSDLVYSLDIDYSKLEEIEMSGQSNLTVLDKLTALEDIDLSGQSSMTITVEVENLHIDLSGQSDLTLNRSIIDTMKIDVSGQSELKLTNSVVSRVKGNVSGMAEVRGNGNKISKSKVRSTGMSEYLL